MKAILLLTIFQSFNVIYGQLQANCTQLKSNSCSSCLQTWGCVWCSDEGHTGARCSTLEESQCNQTVTVDGLNHRNIDPSLCKLTNETGTPVCEGNGKCECGVCKCNRDRWSRYYGKYCQCSDFNCDTSDNMLCGGPEKGQCRCGICSCRRGFKGSNCGDVDCSLLMNACFTREEGKPLVNCSNHGDCQCGRCKCDVFYEGTHCENCPSCADRCGDYQECVLCKVFGVTPANGTLCDNCPKIETVANLTVLKAYQFPTMCQETDEERCTYYYTYYISEYSKELRVYAAKSKDCPNSSSESRDVQKALVIVLAVIGGLFGISIIL